jgi:subtilisin family serine protease
MADSFGSLRHTIALAAVILAAAACSDSTKSSSRAIVGHVTITPGDARIPAERLVGQPRLPALAARRPSRYPRINIVFRGEAVGIGRSAALSVRSLGRARTVGAAIRARLAVHPSSALFTVTDVSPTIGAARIRLRDPATLDALLRALRADPAVASASEDHLLSRGPMGAVKLTGAALEQIRGVRASTTPGAEELRFAGASLSHVQYWNYNLVDAPRAWALPDTGAATIVVAIVDDGINQHPDVAPNLDMAGGYDFVSDDTDEFGDPVPFCNGPGSLSNADADATPGPDPDPTMPIAAEYDPDGGCFAIQDIANHGLHIAGTIGATNNPANIVTGINWNVRIRPVRGLGVDGFGYNFDIAQAVLYAAGLPASGAGGNLVVAPNAAPIINMSLGGESDSTLGAAVGAAIAAGSVIIASAGNEASYTPNFPASYPDVISVAALGADGELASYSSTNAFVALTAPGGDFRFDNPTSSVRGTSGVLSTVWDFNPPDGADWAFYTGTSMAAPHVAGVAALVLAANPGMTGPQLRERLISTAVDMGPPGYDTRYGYGRVDAYNAITGQPSPPMKIFVSAIDANSGETVKTVQAASDNSYSLTGLAVGSYYVVAGQDENDDGIIGFPGRRYGWSGGAVPLPVSVGPSGAVDAAIPIGLPTQQVGVTGRLFVNSWVYGSSGAPGTVVSYQVTVPTAGTYTFETSGAIGSCGFALELNTVISVVSAASTVVATNDNTSSATGAMTFPGARCSHVSATLQPGTYTVQVSGSSVPAFNPGTFRLHVRSGA